MTVAAKEGEIVSSEIRAALTSFSIILALNEIHYHAHSQYIVTHSGIQPII
ncbi:hypothetical protein THOB06_50151 [Vibrio rotiferianus]|nr:hypothetical protein THOG10_50151 [Vibrio rotiferianus]CAH1591586.1 hypothetical protein THOB06_50151 [Vibrio rotiferianus]